ncbi:hypothetical protein AAFC00_005076 [Neodothiora populina]|uniref:Mitochondrial cytochrome c oxidase assembly factor n=1 Tax=Neodothiora populina TaxID=2781224 RepID=A0ABR3PJQ1_9PEZI
MGGPNLEVFKFGMYIFFPIGWMYYFGTNLDQRFSVPDFWPKKNETNQIPFEREDIKEELERLKARRLAAKARREQFGGPDADAEGETALVGEDGPKKSVYLRTLENVKPAPVPVVPKKEEGGKGWFGLW